MTPEAGLRRVRQVLLGLGAYWVLMAGITLAFPDVQVEQDAGQVPPLWVTAGSLGLMAALHGLAALWIGPKRPMAWAMTTLTAGLSVMGCLTTPVAIYLLVLLFKAEVMLPCLGRKLPEDSGD
ncbi:MAG: hypothetical protein GY913_26960 [Proteobacteria bacterium]|nr:hypothetical protein [Pseudomonadota bacterium]MCP4920555.1 hypothetical protein [Pseudomonadota bacterium]